MIQKRPIPRSEKNRLPYSRCKSSKYLSGFVTSKDPPVAKSAIKDRGFTFGPGGRTACAVIVDDRWCAGCVNQRTTGFYQAPEREPEAGSGSRTRLQTGHLWPFCKRFASRIAASAAGAGVFPEPASRKRPKASYQKRHPAHDRLVHRVYAPGSAVRRAQDRRSGRVSCGTPIRVQTGNH